MRKNKQRGGIFLLEALLVCLLMEIIFVLAIPSAQILVGQQQQTAAQKNIMMVRDAQVAIAGCTANNTPTLCIGEYPIVGALPQITAQYMNGYNYLFTKNGSAWTYTAIAADNPNLMSFYVDQNEQIICSPWGNPGPGQGQVCF